MCCQCRCCRCRCGLCCGCQCQCPSYKRKLCCFLCRCCGCFFKCFCCLPPPTDDNQENEYLLPSDNDNRPVNMNNDGNEDDNDPDDDLGPGIHVAVPRRSLRPVLDMLPVLGSITRQQHHQLDDKKWYHRNISREVAHDRLLKGGINGSYLVFDHPDEEGHYILLIYYNGKAMELKISKRQDDDLYVLETGYDNPGYKTVRELIKSYRQDVSLSMQQAKPLTTPTGIQLTTGETIVLNKMYISRPNETSMVQQADDLQHKKWYHGAISAETAEIRLREAAQQNGAYLVYDHPNEMGNYVLLVYFESSVYRWKISRILMSSPDGPVEYVLGDMAAEGGVTHRSVKELIKAHRGITGRPIRLDNGKLVTLSKSYIMR